MAVALHSDSEKDIVRAVFRLPPIQGQTWAAVHYWGGMLGQVLLPFLTKTEKDRRHLPREGFKGLLDDGARFAESLAIRASRVLNLNARRPAFTDSVAMFVDVSLDVLLTQTPQRLGNINSSRDIRNGRQTPDKTLSPYAK